MCQVLRVTATLEEISSSPHIWSSMLKTFLTGHFPADKVTLRPCECLCCWCWVLLTLKYVLMGLQVLPVLQVPGTVSANIIQC